MNEDELKISDTAAALAAGAALGDVRPLPLEIAGVGGYTVVPEGYRIESLENYLLRPVRVRQGLELHDTESFIAYVKEYKRKNETHLFFDVEHERFAAVIDYHTGANVEVERASWCDHIAVYKPRNSEEWKVWAGQNARQMEQVEFARFIEANLPDIVEPAGAVMLELALTFEAKKEVEYSSGVRLQNGQIQFTYNEVVRGQAQKGTIETPDTFVLGIPIHENGPAYRIPVRFRWRLKDGRAAFWYEIVRPRRFVIDALREMRETVASDTGLAVLSGAIEE